MKQLLITTLLFIGIASANSLSSQETQPATDGQPEYKMGIGVRLSSAPAVVNNSISFKYFLNSRAAVEALVSFGDPAAIGLTFQYHNPLGTPGLKWFYGAGAYLGFGSDVNLGAQGVVGLDYKFNNIPLNLSLDWKPELNIIEDINFEPAALGFTARFTFGH